MGKRIQICDRGLIPYLHPFLPGTVKDGDKFNYINHTRDGKIFRSSSTYFHDDDGKLVFRHTLARTSDIHIDLSHMSLPSL